MPQGLQAVLALGVLLPGFVSARIVRIMSGRIPETELERIIEALIFSFFTYVCYFALFGSALPFDWSVPISANPAAHYGLIVHRWRLLGVVFISVALGSIWGYIKDNDIAHKLLRISGLTQRQSRQTVWGNVFLNFGGNVQVGLGDGRSVIGWLRQYSETGDERAVFIEQAAWVAEDGSITEVPGDGYMLLTEKSEIKYVMFLDEGHP